MVWEEGDNTCEGRKAKDANAGLCVGKKMARNTIRGNVYSPNEDYPSIVISNPNPLLYFAGVLLTFPLMLTTYSLGEKMYIYLPNTATTTSRRQLVTFKKQVVSA